jgi:radical SAM superfamily enzyme YgiQ (UPF0313 family)
MATDRTGRRVVSPAQCCAPDLWWRARDSLRRGCIEERTFDYITIGESEGALLEFVDLLEQRKDVRSVRNLGYLDDSGTPVINR